MSEQKKCNGCNGTGISALAGYKKAYPEDMKCSWCDGCGFDVSGTDDIVCPHCGHEQSDSWEMRDSGATYCGECSKQFHVEVSHSVSYTSKRVPCLNDESLHRWKKVDWYDRRDSKTYAHCRHCDVYAWVANEKVCL